MHHQDQVPVQEAWCRRWPGHWPLYCVLLWWWAIWALALATPVWALAMSAALVAAAVVAVVVLAATATAAMCSIILGSIVMISWWKFLPSGHLGLAVLLLRWPVMGVNLLLSIVIVGVASSRAAAVGMPFGRVDVIVVDALP